MIEVWCEACPDVSGEEGACVWSGEAALDAIAAVREHKRRFKHTRVAAYVVTPAGRVDIDGKPRVVPNPAAGKQRRWRRAPVQMELIK